MSMADRRKTQELKAFDGRTVAHKVKQPGREVAKLGRVELGELEGEFPRGVGWS